MVVFVGVDGARALVVCFCDCRAQVFVSAPHFLGGNPDLVSNVTGLTPGNLEEHGSYVNVEPVRDQQRNCVLESRTRTREHTLTHTCTLPHTQPLVPGLCTGVSPPAVCFACAGTR